MTSSVPLARRVTPALVVFALLATVLAAHGGEARRTSASATTCPPGFKLAGSGNEPVPTANAQPGYEVPGGAYVERESGCVPRKGPESFAELAVANGEMLSRDVAPYTSISADAYANSIRERDAMPSSGIRGTGGRWTRYGHGPLISNDPDYPEAVGYGWADLNGRISDFARSPRTSDLYAAVSMGGVWRSRDAGKTWRSIGEKLPTQVTGSITWTRGGGGTLLVLTGDNVTGGNSLAGLGVYRTTNNGRTWKRSRGVPRGALGYRITVDERTPRKIYAATSLGLYRSTNAGRSFRNVRLPTTKLCKRRPTVKRCLLANHVTDVVVQAPDKFGHKGGRVLAAVGWRAGQKRNENGKMQSPRNGLYLSRSGRPGTFKKLEAPGFARQAQIGRVELGAARGKTQNHNYVYAIVQDAIKMNRGVPGIDANEAVNPVGYSTVLDGIYVSSDFGKTWTKMADATELQEPSTGSSLTVVGSAIYAPGIQAWYNEWIQPDPSREVNGIPTRLTFGLEEIWQNELTQQPQNGKSQFKVIGRYWDYCLFLVKVPACPTDRPGQTGELTTHPDQHGGLYFRHRDGGVSLLAGGDGGVYKQRVAEGEEFVNNRWGEGNNDGFNTLMAYDARMAKDGTVYAGLQDNGEMKISPDGTQRMTYGGDGFYTAVDPDNSDIAYEEYVGGVMAVTTDGGKHWRDIDPGLSNPAFSVPFMMDPKDAKHLIIGGRDIAETIYGPETGRTGDWERVYDLGTRKHPGDADAEADSSADDPSNRLSAVDLLGDNAYVGYCGFCDVITQGTPFDNGIATNVGGKQPPKRMTSQGWHIAKAYGLPRRFITSIEIHPRRPKTIFVTLAGYMGRRWAKPGIVGERTKGIRAGRGHVFKSTDAGNHFTNISGNLPNTPANYVVKRGRQLIVGTDIGVFISNNLRGSRWARLGPNLPTTPVLSLQVKPGNARILVAGTFGRGVYTYRFP